MKLKPKPIYIEWFDPTSVDEWREFAEIQKMEVHKITTLGYLIKENASSCFVSLNVDIEREGSSCSMIIPKSSITKRKWVKL